MCAIEWPTVFVTLCWIPEIATTDNLWISAASEFKLNIVKGGENNVKEVKML